MCQEELRGLEADLRNNQLIVDAIQEAEEGNGGENVQVEASPVSEQMLDSKVSISHLSSLLKGIDNLLDELQNEVNQQRYQIPVGAEDKNDTVGQGEEPLFDQFDELEDFLTGTAPLFDQPSYPPQIWQENWECMNQMCKNV